MKEARKREKMKGRGGGIRQNKSRDREMEEGRQSK